METTFIPSGITFWTWARLWVNIHLTCLWTPPSSTLTKLKSLSGFIALGRSLDIEVKTQSSKSMKGCNDGFQNNFFRMHSQGMNWNLREAQSQTWSLLDKILDWASISALQQSSDTQGWLLSSQFPSVKLCVTANEQGNAEGSRIQGFTDRFYLATSNQSCN